MNDAQIVFKNDGQERFDVVEVSTDALNLLATCINEAIEAVGEWEFSIRLGFSVDEARALARQVDQVLATRRREGP